VTPAPIARDTAQRLIAREAATAGSAAEDPAAAERALRRLIGELAEWFGPFGTHALLARALAHARAEHPALAGVTVGVPSAPAVQGLVDGPQLPGAAADLLAWVVELLGRLIGDDLATGLIERGAGQGHHVAPPAPLPPVSPVVGGAADTGAGNGTDTMSDTTGSTTDD
jgi:hypothetical protein